MPNTSVITKKTKNESQNLLLRYQVNIDTINTILTVFTAGQEVTFNSEVFKTGSATGHWKVTKLLLQTSEAGRVKMYSGTNVILNLNSVANGVIYFSDSKDNPDSIMPIESVNAGENLRIESESAIVDAFISVEFS